MNILNNKENLYYNAYVVHQDELDKFEEEFDQDITYYYENAFVGINNKEIHTKNYNAAMYIVGEKTKKEPSFWGKLN